MEPQTPFAMPDFKADLQIIGINPFVSVPEEILTALFAAAGKSTSPIPIRGTLNGKPYQQTLVKYRGAWRLYVNLKMLKDSPRRIGEMVTVAVEFDPVSREVEPDPRLTAALAENPEARLVYESLPASLRQEIIRYISNLKTEVSVDRNVRRAIGFLLGRERFLGRDHP